MKKKLLIFFGLILVFLFITNPTSTEFVNYGKAKHNRLFEGGKMHDFFICSVFYGQQRFKYNSRRSFGRGNIDAYTGVRKTEKYLGIAGMFFKL